MATPFIRPWLSVNVYPRVNGARDSHNEPVVSFGPAVAGLACGIWFAGDGPGEVQAAGHTRVHTIGHLIAPATVAVTPHDRVEVNGDMFEVIGEARDHTNGPWWNPGCVVWELSRIEGG